MAFRGAKGSVTIIDRATKPLRSIASSFLKLGKSSAKANTDLSRTQKAINGISKAQNRLNRVNQNIKRNTRDIGSQAVGVVAMGLAFKAALNPAIKFEQSMKDLEAKAFGFADASVNVKGEMKKLSDQAKELGATTRFTAIEAAGAQFKLAGAGLKTQDMLKTMPAVLDLAAASGIGLVEAADTLTNVLKPFDLAASQSTRVADLLAAATSSTNVDMTELAKTLEVVAPIGATYNQTIESMVVATGLLGNVGIKGEKAATGIKNAMINIVNPVGRGRAALEKLGVEVSDSMGNILPFNQLILNLSKSLKGMSQVQQSEAFSAVFGKEALAGGISLSKVVKSGEFNTFIKQFSDVHGVSRKMALIRMDSTEGSFIQMTSAINGVAISFGTILTPALRGLATVMTAIASPIGKLINDFPILSQVIGIVAGTLLAGKVIVLGYTASMWLITPAISALSFMLGVVKAPLIVFNALLAANPVGLVVAGVMALAAIGIVLYNNWEPVGTFFSELWETIKGLAKSFTTLPDLSAISDFAGSAFENVTSFFGGGEAPAPIAPANSTNNTPVSVAVSITDNKVKGIETSGGTKTDVFLNNGAQN